MRIKWNYLNRRLLIVLMALSVSGGIQARQSPAAPEFTQTEASEWINSPPLTLKHLRNTVVLIDVWTYGCGNCRRSVPWLQYLQKKYANNDFLIVGIHSPEFPWEKIKFLVESQVDSLGITYPVMLDNDLAYWNALNNQYWPAFYLMNKKGQVVGGVAGELHVGDLRAQRFEHAIDKLLK